jgi:hypothetical protein
LVFKLQKTSFRGLRWNMWLIHFNRAPAANNWQQQANQQILETGYPVDSGNKFPLKFKQIISSMPISAISQW